MEGIHVEEHASRPRCPYCHEDVGGAAWTCPGCGTAHHEECVREARFCTVLGCRRAYAGQGVAPAPRQTRPLQAAGAPRTDFRIGVVLTVLGVALNAWLITSFTFDSGFVFGQVSVSVLVAGLLTIGHSLRRRRREGRWRH
jgi:hypothetical protein